jgi:hypothetical protein
MLDHLTIMDMGIGLIFIGSSAMFIRCVTVPPFQRRRFSGWYDKLATQSIILLGLSILYVVWRLVHIFK